MSKTLLSQQSLIYQYVGFKKKVAVGDLKAIISPRKLLASFADVEIQNSKKSFKNTGKKKHLFFCWFFFFFLQK